MKEELRKRYPLIVEQMLSVCVICDRPANQTCKCGEKVCGFCGYCPWK